MKRFLSVLFALLAVCTAGNAATLSKPCVVINEIKNGTPQDKDFFDLFFRTYEIRLQDAIVNTKKFDVVDDKRMTLIVDQLKKGEMKLSDDEVDVNFKMATISIHGTLIELTVDSQEVVQNNVHYAGARGSIAGTFQIYDMTNLKVIASKQLERYEKQSDPVINTSNVSNTSKRREVVLGMTPEKTVKNEKGEYVVVPATQITAEFSPLEEKMFNDLIQYTVDFVLNMLMEDMYPLSVMSASNGKVYINLPEERAATLNAKEGSTFEILQMGEELIDPDTGEVLGAEEEQVMVVKADSIRPKYVVAVPVEKAENFPILEKGMKEYREKLDAATTKLEKSKIKPPFQVRLLQDAGKKEEKTESDDGPFGYRGGK